MLRFILVINCLGPLIFLYTNTAPAPGEENNPYKITQRTVYNTYNEWDIEDPSNIWEHSTFIEGDILPSTRGADILEKPDLWENGEFCYFIQENDFNPHQVDLIKKAMEDIQRIANITFREKNDNDKYWVNIQGTYPGCFSHLGQKFRGQIMNLAPDKCFIYGVVLHEIFHALGFHHQHSISDRDNYIKIIWKNIAKNRRNNFVIRNEANSFGVEYDYQSIMHYSRISFTKNGHDTIVPMDGQAKIGQRKSLSDKDKLKLINAYGEKQDDETE